MQLIIKDLQYSQRREGYWKERERQVYETDSTSLRDEFAEISTFDNDFTRRIFDLTTFQQRFYEFSTTSFTLGAMKFQRRVSEL